MLRPHCRVREFVDQNLSAMPAQINEPRPDFNSILAWQKASYLRSQSRIEINRQSRLRAVSVPRLNRTTQ
jgi:hypothetical protein